MEFPEGDRFWLDTYKFIEQHLQTADKIVAPQEFQEKLSNVTDYLSWRHEELATDFQWLIIHKGRLAELGIELFQQVESRFQPVYGNEVFVVFSSYNHLPSLDYNSSHFQAFTEKLTRLKQEIISNPQRGSSFPAIYLGDNTALTKTIYGHKLYVDTRDISLAPHLLLDGYWESWINKVFLNLIKPGMRVVEVGANVGYYSLLAASKVGSSGFVYSFEANPRIYNLLRKNLDINGFVPISNCINKAVTDAVGMVNFKVFQEYMGSSYVASLYREKIETYETEIIEVESTSLDIFFDNDTCIDLLKIDAEGAEPLIIKGAYNLLKNNQNIKIIIEFNIENFENENQAYEYLEIFNDLGFKLNLITEDSSIIPIEDQKLVNQPYNYELLLFR